MYTTNFIANSDYLIKYLLQQRVLKDEFDSRQLAYDIVNDAVDTKEIISEYPRIVAQVKNIGQFPIEEIIPMVNNIRLTRRPVSVNRSDVLRMFTKHEYLNQCAINYMIIAKPGIATYKLAKKMEQHFKCVHIDCNDLVTREIQSKSRLGKWLDINLQLNKILPIEIILWLVQRETKNIKVTYRGYVLTGLPIIPNTDLNVKRNFLTEEDLLAFQQIIDEIIDVPTTLRAFELAKLKEKLFSEYEHFEDDADDLKEDLTEQIEAPKGFRPLPQIFHQLSCERDVRFSIKRQLYFALDLKSKPSLLIYMDCDDADIFTKNIIFNNRTPDELESIRIALKRYNNALDIIQEFICYFPRPNLIYCHGIFTPADTFRSCSDKIKECSIRQIFLAKDFYETFKDDENIIEQLEGISNPNSILDILCKINPICDDLGWFRSSFENKCPVMLTQGKCVIGKYQHSVLFTGLIYLLSSDENKRIFLENPQIFIQSYPTCRVYIMGPRCSGKSTFARCLSIFFKNSTIIDVNYLFDYYKKIDLKNLYYGKACDHAIMLLSSELLVKYNDEQQILDDKIKDWIKVMTQNISDFLKPIPTKKGKNKKAKPIPDKTAVEEKERLRNLLNEFSFETGDPIFLKSYLNSKDMFLNKLPLELRRKATFRKPQPDDTDVKKLAMEYMKELSKDYVLPLARKLEILVTKIRLCEKRQKLLTKENKLYGYWVLDGVPPDTNLFQGLQEMGCLPDIIVYMDDTVGERLAENQNIKCNRKFYDINYVTRTVAIRYKVFFKHMMNKIPFEGSESPKLFKHQLVRREVDHILMQESLQGTRDFQEENGKYREHFEEVKSFLKSCETHLIQVDIHGTSWSGSIIGGLRDYMNYFNAYPHIMQNNWFKGESKKSGRLLRTGCTAEYCPVLFVDKLVLKLGLPQNAVQLKNRTYLFSTQEALQTFVQDPLKYSEIERPFRIPPYRLCVIGNYHVAKRGDLRRVADILGTRHLKMENIINLYFGKTKSDRNFNISSFYEILEDLNDSVVNDIFAPLFDEGFLLEDFPQTAEQLQQMIKQHLCPEQIFYLKIDHKHLMKDELKYYMQKYKDVLLRKIDACKLQNEDWMRQRKLRFDELFAELSYDVVADEEGNYAERLESDNLTDILDAFEVKVNLERDGQIRQLYVADMVNEEMPPDLYTKIIDEMMKISIKQAVIHFIQSRMAEYEKIKSVAEENLIPFIQIRLHPYTTKQIENMVLKYIKVSSDRQYIFERVQPVSYEYAVRYVRHGQFLLSRYFWTCPVKNRNMNYPIKLTLSTPHLDKRLQPFIHQENIYFVQRVHHNVDEFFAHSYLYTSQMNVCHITKPIRLALHGPRHSGCQALCKRIAEEFQLNNFTLHGMKEYVVNNFKWTKLATDLIKNGMLITDNQQICDLVKISINFETEGWILRDIPLNDDLVKCFMLNGLDLNLIIYLDPTGLDLWTNVKNEYNKEKYKQKMEVLQHLHGIIRQLENFATHCSNFKGLKRNVITIKDFTSKWSTWNKAYREILLLLRLHNIYEMRGIQLVAGSLYKLDVTDYELQYRLGPLKLYCPLCWMQNNLLVKQRYYYSDDEEAEPLYTDNLYEKNLFQFRKYFYWSCNKHLVEMMINAESYLTANDEQLPEELPKLIKEWKDCMNVTNDGYCPVAYYETGEIEIIIGLAEYSVLYYNNIYVMSSQSYCIQFIQNPNKYKDVEIIFDYSQESTIDEDFKNMKLDFGTITPTLITNALFECAFERPKHFNLEPGQSLEVYLGLYLKCHNTSSDNSEIDFYKTMFLKFWDDCKLVQRNINEMQISGNPYILHGKKTIGSSVIRGSSTSTIGF